MPLKDGYTVMVLNSIQSYSLRELYIRKAKTDARDSLIIADLVRFGRCKARTCPRIKSWLCGSYAVADPIS